MNFNIGIAGISGRLGQQLINLIESDESLSISCGFVSKHSQFCHNKIDINSTCKKSDIWIDFSTPNAFEKVLGHCVDSKTPFVSGTTGLSKKHFIELEHAAESIPVLWASNFAISVNLIQHLLSRYTKLKPSDVEITETHHIDKLDKPSGTAISLARSVNPHGMLKNNGENKFTVDAIKINSKREAQVAGNHTVLLDNESESIEISHSAKSPRIFAQGAINVAKWLIDKPPGFYTMKDYIDSLI